MMKKLTLMGLMVFFITFGVFFSGFSAIDKIPLYDETPLTTNIKNLNISKIDASQYKTIEAKNELILTNTKNSEWFRMDDFTGQIREIAKIKGNNLNDFSDYNVRQNSLHFVKQGSDLYYDLDDSTYKKGTNTGDEKGIGFKLYEDRSHMGNYLFWYLEAYHLDKPSFPISKSKIYQGNASDDTFYQINSIDRLASGIWKIKVGNRYFYYDYLNNNFYRGIDPKDRTNNLIYDWGELYNGFDFWDDYLMIHPYGKTTKIVYDSLYSNYQSLYHFQKGLYSVDNDLFSFVINNESKNEIFSTKKVFLEHNDIVINAKQINNGNYYLQTQNNRLYYYDFNECTLVDEHFTGNLLYATDTFWIIKKDGKLTVEFNGIQFNRMNANATYNNGWIFDSRDVEFYIKNQDIRSLSINNKYLSPEIDNQKFWKIDLLSEQYSLVTNFKIQLEFNNFKLTTYKFEIIENYMPPIEVDVPSLGNKKVKRFVYEQIDQNLIDGYHSNYQMEVDFTKDKKNLIKYVFVDKDPFTLWMEEAYKINSIFEGSVVPIKIIDKFEKEWNYNVYYRAKDKIYWNADPSNPSESERGIENTTKAHNLGYTNYNLQKMNAYESKELTNHIENYVLDLSNIALWDWQNVDFYVEDKIIEWYGARIPINRINFNYSLDKNEQETGTTLKEVVINSYIEGMNKFFGNGVLFEGEINQTDVAFNFKNEDNELINRTNKWVKISGTKEGLDAKVTGTLDIDWGSAAIQWLDLSELGHPNYYFIPYLESGLFNDLKKYNKKPIKFKNVQKELNTVVVDSINVFLKSDDNNITAISSDWKTNLSKIKDDEVNIVWNLNHNKNIDTFENFNLEIKGSDQSLATGRVNLEITNWMYDYDYPIKNMAGIWILLGVFIGGILLTLIILIVRYFKAKHNFILLEDEMKK